MTLRFTKEKVALQEVIIGQKEKQNTLYALGGAAVSLLLALMVYLFFQLRNQKNKVDELNEQLTEHIDFQNSVSTVLTHDIRNFLNALQVGPDLILRQLDRENIPKAKKLTESLGNKFTGMYEAISNILLWATPQLKSGMAGEAEILDIAKLMQAQKSSLTTLAEEKGFSIEYEGPNNKSLHAFKAATEVIIRNAALNALNHSGGDQLILKLSVMDEFWSIQIKDNGKGLDEKTQQVLHISQSEMRQRLKSDQSGFGLWIIRFYSEASQAEIDYTFKDGWSTFQFDFPQTLNA
jgi:two-component system sensor histidine kinase MtrB